MEMFRIFLAACILLWNSIYDWRYRKIFIPITLSGIVIAIVFLIISPTGTFFGTLGGVCIGIFLVVCSFITKGQIGTGDGIICCFTGLCLGFFENMGMVFIGLCLSALVSVFLLISKKAGRKTEIPLVPFLFAGFCCIQIMKI